MQQRYKRQALAFGVVVTLCLLAPVALVSLWPVPPHIAVPWDWANGMGYMALASSLFLFIYKGRARRFPAFSGRFFANLHRDLGYITLFLLSGHVGILLLAEPLLLAHLKPTAPLHMLAGLLALVLMVLLVVSSIPVCRRSLWPDYHLFRHLHALTAVAIVALTFYHVLASGFYLNSPWKLGLVTALGTGILAYYTAYKYRPVAASASRTRHSARYSHLISYGSALLALLLCLALVLEHGAE